jgi:Leucine-rich repeat (LRR) protein
MWKVRMRVLGQISFIKKIYQRIPNPPVIGSKMGFSGRISPIQKDSYVNPRAGAALALGMSIVVTCLTIGVAFAQTLPNRSEFKIVHFPEDRSLGKLYIQDMKESKEFEFWFHWTRVGEESEYLCEAKGDVRVPAGKRLSLTINPAALNDLSGLSKLRPDDLYGMGFNISQRNPATDDCLLHLAHLTGLKSLNISRTDITDNGMKYIANLKSLESLEMPNRVTDRGMVYVGQLTSLRRLYFNDDGGSQVTNRGMRHLANLKNLEELALTGGRMGDAGLAYIKDLPKLYYLFIRGRQFGDNGMIHVKEISSLRMLVFHEGIAHITDAGLVHISQMPHLETLCLHGMEGVSDGGIAHLSKMPLLKRLNIDGSHITDKSMAYLEEVKSLEWLDLPQRDQRITDVGLACLGELSNLRKLHINKSSLVNHEYYTDKGLETLVRCHKLEELNIGSIGITDAGIDHIVKLNNLKKLMLFGCENMTDAGLAKLTTLKSLTNLYVAHADISIKGLNNLKPMPNLTKLDVFPVKRDGAVLNISGLTAMEELHLSFAPYSQDSFVDADLKCLTELKRLRWLQIGPRNYTDKGLAYLAGLTNMERLGIGGSGLTDDGLEYLKSMKKLNFLSILSGFDRDKRDYGSGGDITDKGLHHLEELKQLGFLEIYSDNEFSDGALRRLWKELPNLFTLRINGGTLLKIGDGKN